jgi:methyl-accepting chemotaxis protein
MKQRSTLERQMLSYFGLIAAASLLITVEFIWAIQAIVPKAVMLIDSRTSAGHNGDVLLHALTTLRNQALIMFVVQAVVTLIVLIMLIRRITGPLQQMVEHSRIISEGDLSKTIEVRRQDEIGLLGETINGLTSNIQEIVALSLTTESSLRSSLDELRKVGPAAPDGEKRMAEIDDTLSGFRDILEDFKLFPAPLTGKDADGGRPR